MKVAYGMQARVHSVQPGGRMPLGKGTQQQSQLVYSSPSRDGVLMLLQACETLDSESETASWHAGPDSLRYVSSQAHFTLQPSHAP